MEASMYVMRADHVTEFLSGGISGSSDLREFLKEGGIQGSSSRAGSRISGSRRAGNKQGNYSGGNWIVLSVFPSRGGEHRKYKINCEIPHATGHERSAPKNRGARTYT
jgi:hypothetical protein